MDLSRLLGESVTVIVDRPLGTTHPNHKDIIYPVNYGYIENLLAGDGEEQDVYILGVDERVDTFMGTVIAIIHRLDDVEDKLAFSPQAAKDRHKASTSSTDNNLRIKNPPIFLLF